MACILILYATAEGQTARIARHIAERLSGPGHSADLVEAHAGEQIPAPADYDAVIVGASVHYGRHPAWLAMALRRHGAALGTRPGAFFSVSLGANPEYATSFLSRARWRPDTVATFAGALKYRQYGWFKRLLVQAFARIGGHETDVSHDHEYTDWNAVARFANAFAERCSRA